MTRVPTPGFEPRVAEWLENDLNVAPATVLETVLASVPLVLQRRARRVPWRFPPMNAFAKLVVAAVAVVALGALGLSVLQRDGPPVAGPGGSTVPAIATPRAQLEPDGSPAATGTDASVIPALTEHFALPADRVTFRYPSNWLLDTSRDGVIYVDTTTATYARFVVQSEPIPAGQTAAEWIAAGAALYAERGCGAGPNPPEIAVGARTGFLLANDCRDYALRESLVVASVGDRGYRFLMNGTRHIDLGLFEALLATVVFEP